MSRIQKVSIEEIDPSAELILARPIILGTGVKGFNSGIQVSDKVVAALKRLGFSEVWITDAEDGIESIVTDSDEIELTETEKFQKIKNEMAEMLADIMTEKDPEREVLRIRQTTRGNSINVLMNKGALTKVDPERPSAEIKLLKTFSESIIRTDKLEKLMSTCRDLLEGPFSPMNIKNAKINLSDNRSEDSYIFNHLANCGLYFLAVVAMYNADLKERGAVSSELKYSAGFDHERRKSTLFFYSDEEVLSGALGAFMHDIGYLHSGMPEILNKKGKLTPEEHNVLKCHVEVSMNILQYHAFFDSRPLARNVIENHHERLDGTGYPKGRTNFHIFSRVLGMIDTFDSLTTDRPWRRKFSRAKVLEWLYSNSKERTSTEGNITKPQYDMDILKAFERVLLLYEDNEVVDIYHVKSPSPLFKCVVKKQNRARPDRPIVELLSCYPNLEKNVAGKEANLLSMDDLYLGESTDFRKESIV